MAISSKDIEILWKRYSSEAVKRGVSVTQFFESNGVPYHVFENKDSLAQKYIELISNLYKVELESILLHRTEAEVLKARKTESIPILNELDQKASLLMAKIKSKSVKVTTVPLKWTNRSLK